jgi:hypothetical protein
MPWPKWHVRPICKSGQNTTTASLIGTTDLPVGQIADLPVQSGQQKYFA